MPQLVKDIARGMLAPFWRGRSAWWRKRKQLGTYITLHDLYEIPRLTMQGLVAWTLPESLWWRFSTLLGPLNVATHPTRTRNETAEIAALLGETPASENIHAIVFANWANRYEERFHYLRDWRPGGWKPSIDIEGAEHVSAALDDGRGVVLWGSNFAFNNLVPKMAMHRLGLEVIGFSVPIHGISTSRFGILTLNRLYRDIERRYLRERMMVEVEQFPAALERMRAWLKINGVVYFAVGGRGRRTAEARFLGGRIVIATGPVAMAERTGAALLPLYTFRAGPGRFQVTIGPPIVIPKDQGGNTDYNAAIQAYADALAPFVLRDPGQWFGWHLIRQRDAWGGKQRALRAQVEAQPHAGNRSDHA